MDISSDEAHLLLRLDEVRGFGKEAKRYVWSTSFAEDAASGRFFDLHAMDSDERLWVNEVASYFELTATLWQAGLLGDDAVDAWCPAGLYWGMLGDVLLAARALFVAPQLWEHFEALAAHQRSD